MRLKANLLLIVGLSLGVLANPVLALAGPHFTLTPASGNQTVGQNFVVALGVDSGTDKVVGIDIKMAFDSAKLEMVSVEKGVVPDDGYQFSYTAGQAIIDNATGVMEVTLPSRDTSILVGPVAKHELLKVTFKPKTTGVATVSYTCTANSVVETNIIADTGMDVVDCAANQSGSYTIATGTGGDSGTTPTTVVATPTTGSSTLPQTGAVENTIALMLFGVASAFGARYFMKI
jgi:hypothetical protein